MHKVVSLIAVVSIALVLGGCVKVSSHTTLADDGSGTVEMTVSILPAVQTAFAELKDLDGGQSQYLDFPLLDDMKQDAIEAAGRDHGVTVRQYARSQVNGRETLHLVLDFANLEGLGYVVSRVMGDTDRGDGMGVFDAGDGNLVLRQTHYDYPVEPEAATDRAASRPQTPEMMQKQMEIMGRLMDAMAELDVSVTITVPGDIVSSNAPRTAGRSSIWTLDAKDVMTTDLDLDPEIVFSGRGVDMELLAE